MDWNVKSPLQWDWENAAIGTGSVYSSAGGAFSSSDLGNGSSRSSISASIDSSLKAGVKISEFNFENVEGSSPKGLSKNKELARMEDTGTSPVVAAKGGLGEPLIGLKLGKRTYFEDVCAGNSTKTSTASTSVAPVTAIVKKTRVSHQSVPNSRCQVEGCNIDLTGAKDYHRKHRVCESHSKCPKVIIAGQERRFCQQCSRFHELSEFDLKKRSCRRRLSDHNARRRKPLSDTISFNSSRLASSFYDGRQQMNFVLNRSPFGNMRPTASSTWEDSCGFSLTHSRGSWIKSMKTRGMDGHLHFSNYDLSNTVSSLPQGLDKLMPLKGTTTEVLSQGLGAPVPDPNLDGGPDLRRALSLLSTDSWGSVNPGQSNLSHYVNASHNSSSHPTMQQAVNTSTYWQDQQSLHQQERVVPFDLHNNGSQYQELQLPKAPYETSFFDSGQILSKSDGHFLELT
ncbi:uncharacterized protein A4U43_C05F6790 [Asparagus officinalis]|uniref:SBP-type domain-containing protein n=1 Tax=Asparagus officinalis TaxID=4686 RepID=A0A5P1EU73_ASPOF|nr:squamosa promoter-binding-like protein 12 [Asparagus officinalis]XP_020267886.1 squamosa promoter-binding-like protein 12 [Asparagus officinalis]XP_020267887.1 squamosa promoter-binding-like protein 12 [Asparagus officinalis]XP_020267888.1 squamosa promoter-binding-like protein 12 [Asparagus officinalis]ONK68051.1 uncharacterized protein A4U43_C05F6790 [Asparagus officinalis]